MPTFDETGRQVTIAVVTGSTNLRVFTEAVSATWRETGTAVMRQEAIAPTWSWGSAVVDRVSRPVPTGRVQRVASSVKATVA